MLRKYFPAEFEQKWTEKWKETNLYSFEVDKSKKKFYNLVELPYTSGDLHIGHWFAFSIPDVLARFKRMNGFNVFFPNGYDAFGLPAENAAMKRNIHPQDWTMSNVENMNKQFTTMGTMIDWNHCVITCLPEFYGWNQWIFIKMWEKGLAYRGTALSNWCEKDQTVLANENVENGRCWRCGTEVVQKEVEQWFLKITDYADRLLWTKDTQVDWPESVKTGQNNWIGKKEGMLIKHKVKDMDLKFETFTAYPAWSWADTFIVIAPEHPLVNKLVKDTQYEKEANAFIEETTKITNDERIADKFEKKGVFTGRFAKDPFGGADMPIWIANFALMNFGTGIIRCSAHDPRDYEFAKKYNIELKEVVERNDKYEPVNAHQNKGILKDSGPFTGKKVEDSLKDIIQWIEKEGIGVKKVTYHIHDWSISRQRYWGTPVPMIHCDKCGIVPVSEKDLPVELPYDVDFTPHGKPPLATNETWLKVSCPQCGGDATRDSETLDTFFDSAWYFYRYLNPDYKEGPFRPERVKHMMPVDVYFGGAEHTLGHTLYARFFTKFFKDLGLVDFDEFALKRMQHGVILGPDGFRMSKSRGNVINPDDLVKEYGADTVRLYLAFMMPYEATAPWSTTAIAGVYRFLKRVWDKFQTLESKESDEALVKKLNQTIAKLEAAIKEYKFNTAVAFMMEFMNEWDKASLNKQDAQKFLQILAPFAPFMTEEIWQDMLKEKESIHLSSWPQVNKALLEDDMVTIPIQINGKVRGTVTVSAIAASEKEVVDEAVQNEQVKKWIEGKNYKIIYIKGKILNLIVS